MAMAFVGLSAANNARIKANIGPSDDDDDDDDFADDDEDEDFLDICICIRILTRQFIIRVEAPPVVFSLRKQWLE